MGQRFDIHLLEGTGELFYSGGMRMGMQYVLASEIDSCDYILLINDDVSFFYHSIDSVVKQSQQQGNAVIVGVTYGIGREVTYSAIKYTKGIKYKKMDIDEWENPADTFNANCVLIPYDVFLDIGTMDGYYIHSLGDFDYGLSLKKNGYKIFPSKEYVGMCERNPDEGTWRDVTLSVAQRIERKESLKGAPMKQWFYFLKKNFGLCMAIKGSITPYVRILMGK